RLAPIMEPGQYYIPAGGYGSLGAKGAADIMNYAGAGTSSARVATEMIHTGAPGATGSGGNKHADALRYTHILCACGTGTMLAGLTQATPSARVIGIAALKHTQLGVEAGQLIGYPELEMIHNFHFGGYAKKTQELLDFMNLFYTTTGIPTDFVYTGKLMFAIRQLIQKQFFPPKSRILAIHSGGLQGNNSLKKGQLLY
ncbi:MAG TPA: hypothetical protein VLA58_06635, partial [Chitinophagaceae bacterium]|nr:hypothetical protein [Chitinophagaceae bacterium]